MDYIFNNKTVESTPDNKSLKSVVDEIDCALNGGAGIRLDPEYQREYKFTREDESLLIESLLLGIPIPVIYLSSDTTKIPYIANVIDGQHRLRAVYRYLKNEFSLANLVKVSELNGYKFNDLAPELQNGLKYQRNLSFVNIHTQSDKNIEIEIFRRYNKGNHPLTPQELRHAVYYDGEFNKWVNCRVESMYNDDKLREIYNLTKKRFSDKTAHQFAYVLLSILYSGLNLELQTSPEYADKFMDDAYSHLNPKKLIELLQIKWDKVNDFLLNLYEAYNIKYPFSKEIYNISTNYHLQAPIYMILVAFFKYLIENNIDIISKSKLILNTIELTLQESYLEDASFKGSNTRPRALMDTYEKLVDNFSIFSS